jgi:3-oxoacyl-(acyl-carrier-protein) synthase
MQAVYIKAVSHISNQQAFSEDWFDNPIFHNTNYVRSIEPDYKGFFSPLEARRLGIILKRAIATTIDVTKKSNINNPDAIITGTGLGCIENTEKFLKAMIANDEEMLTPSYFMQSTHNTIGSQIAIFLKCHGYNSTYSHCGTSFDAALFDAFLQFQLNDIKTALVCAHDELTPDYFNMLGKLNYWKQGAISEDILRNSETLGAFASEASVAFMLTKHADNQHVIKINNIQLSTELNLEKFLQKSNLYINDIDAIISGISGDALNDRIYKEFHTEYFPQKPLLWYKNIFGESYSASALGLYVASIILQQQRIASHLFYYPQQCAEYAAIKPNKILFVNHFQGKEYCLILVERT